MELDLGTIELRVAANGCGTQPRAQFVIRAKPLSRHVESLPISSAVLLSGSNIGALQPHPRSARAVLPKLIGDVHGPLPRTTGQDQHRA